MISNSCKWGVRAIIDVCIQSHTTHREFFLLNLKLHPSLPIFMHGRNYKFVETQNGPNFHEHVLRAWKQPSLQDFLHQYENTSRLSSKFKLRNKKNNNKNKTCGKQ